MNLDKTVLKYIEHELCCYEETKKAIEELKLDVIEASPQPHDGMPKAVGQTSDATGSKTVKIITSQAISRMEKTIRAIDRALVKLEESHRRLFELKYKQTLPWQRVCCEIPLGEATYFRKRKELIYQVAEELGYL